MRLELIAPAREEAIKRSRRHKSLSPPLNLAVVASLTPPDIEVSITDENRTPIDYDQEVDLVGITAVTHTAPRAYHIADRFRRRGVAVVLGGIHPSALPEEAAQHADAVVVGEAEKVWPTLIQDLREGKLRKIYHHPTRPHLNGCPWPRRDLFAKDGYILKQTIATTRGCPFACTFCTVTAFFGKTYRFRPLPEVVEELKALGNEDLIFFVDDNLVGNPKHAKELFRAIAPLKIRWISQGSITMARDDELLRLAAASGCAAFYIGIESLSPLSLATAGKRFNRAEEYDAAIRKIHSHNIAIAGSFIFGFDHDNEDVFEETVRFVKRNRIETPQFGVLTPFPGTVIHQQMNQEGRIVTKDWSKYRLDHVVFEPKLMSRETLQRGHDWAWKETFSLPSILQRVGFLRPNVMSLWASNLNFRGHWQKNWAWHSMQGDRSG